MNNITLYTDASFCCEHDVAGLAFWVKTSDLTLSHSRSMIDVGNSSDAEVYAIVWAVHCISQKIELTRDHRLIIVSDCTHAIDFLKRRRMRTSERAELARCLFSDLTTNLGKVVFNHVKAHTKRKCARSYVNNICDKAARSQMRKKRKEVSHQRALDIRST